MKTVFQTVLQMSVNGSWVVLTLLLLRPLLVKLPRRYAYGLWAAAGFRLLCPVTISSVVSLFRIPYVENGETVIRNAIPQAHPVVMGSNSSAASPVLIAQSEAAVDWMQLLSVVWLIGITLFVAYGAVAYIRLRMRLRTGMAAEKGVWESDRISSPFILDGRIWLPCGLEEQTRMQVLTHEQQHLKRLDPLWKLLGTGILALHWFNPLCHVAFWLFGRDMEISCDEAALKASDRRAYAAALVTVAAKERLAGPLSFGETAVKSRVKNILRWKPVKSWIAALAAVLCLVLFVACVSDGRKDIPADGKYMIANGQTGEDYDIGGLARIEDGRLYYRSTAFDLRSKHWQQPPYDEQTWNVMLENLDGAAPADLEDCDYMELFVLTKDSMDEYKRDVYRDPLERPLEVNLGTSVSTLFLLRQGSALFLGEYYEYDPNDTGPLAMKILRCDRLVMPGSALDPTVETFAWLDDRMDQLLSGADDAEEAKAVDPELYKSVLHHRHIMEYLCHVMMTEGLDGDKGQLAGVLFEDVLVRRFEEPVIRRGSMTHGEYLEAYMAWCLENYSVEQLYNIKNASSPMLAHLTQYYDYGQ